MMQRPYFETITKRLNEPRKFIQRIIYVIQWFVALLLWNKTYNHKTHGRLIRWAARFVPLYFVLSPLVTLFDFLASEGIYHQRNVSARYADWWLFEPMLKRGWQVFAQYYDVHDGHEMVTRWSREWKRNRSRSLQPCCMTVVVVFCSTIKVWAFPLNEVSL